VKYQTLRIAASCLSVLTWVVVAFGVVASIIIGIGAANIIAKVGFLLGGFALTAICALMLLAASKFIYLFIDIEEDLSEIAALGKKESKIN